LEKRLPWWFRQYIPRAGEVPEVAPLLRELNLHTICESGHCPNIGQCNPGGVAFLILGNTCTRNCTFCAVSKDKPLPPDPEEPGNIVKAAQRLNLDYVFITSVTRDDLADGGASHYERTIKLLKESMPGVMVEVLIPDFGGKIESLETVIGAEPEVIGHNIETVPRLYPKVRPMADYRTSVDILKQVKAIDPRVTTKSGLMLGMGETQDEVIGVMRDLVAAGCDLFTMGQYLAPSNARYAVQNYPTPEEFEEYEPVGIELGFKGIVSAPLWRTSFKADILYRRAILGR